MINKLSDTDFVRMVTFVRNNYGINLEKKRELIVSRLAFDIERRGYSSFSDYLNVVTNAPHGAECQHMIDKLSTNHTFFFRETDCIKHMVTKAIPELLTKGVTRISIWCAAASSGQECYSIAMELDYHFSRQGRKLEYSILGTDINDEVLAQAQKAVYNKRELENIPVEYQKCYLRSIDNDSFSVIPELQERMIWKKQNLMEPFIFQHPFDIIFCRNVMIYYQPETRLELMKKLHTVLRKSGYLYLGTTETISLISTGYFACLAPSIYRREDLAA